MRVHVFHRSDPLSWALMPYACERIWRFCETFPTDFSQGAAAFVETFQVNFASPDPRMVLLVVIEGEQLVGHALLDIQTYWKKTVVNVQQLRIDRPWPRAELDQEIARIEPVLAAWAARHGATEFRCLTASGTVARVLRSRYGFEEHGILIRRDIPKDDQGGPSRAPKAPPGPRRLTAHLPVASPGPPPITIHHLGTQGPPEVREQSEGGSG